MSSRSASTSSMLSFASRADLGRFPRYPPELVRQHKEGLRDALNRGNKILAAGGSALDAAVAAVASMEGPLPFQR